MLGPLKRDGLLAPSIEKVAFALFLARRHKQCQALALHAVDAALSQRT